MSILPEEISFLQKLTYWAVAGWVLFVIYSYWLRRAHLVGKITCFFDVAGIVVCLAPLVFFSVLPITVSIAFSILLFSLLPICFPSIKPWWREGGKAINFVYVYLIMFAVLCIAAICTVESISAVRLLLFCLVYSLFVGVTVFFNRLKRQNSQYHHNALLRLVAQIYFNLYNLFLVAMAVLVGLVSVSVIVIMMLDEKGVNNDLCQDTGYCREGIILDDCLGDGKECVINQSNCQKMHGIWIADVQVCQTRYHDVFSEDIK